MTLELFGRKIIAEVFQVPDGFDPITDDATLATGRRFEDLDMRFEVTRDDKANANKCKFDVYNLSDSSAGFAEASQYLRLYAGYQTPEIIFQGDVSYSVTVKQGPDVLTTIEAADGQQKLQRANFRAAFKAPTSVGGLMGQVADSMGLKFDPSKGNLDAGKLAKQLLKGSFADKSKNVMNDLTRSIGADWSVQDNELRVYDATAGDIGSEAVVLSSDTGLIGSPERTKIKQGKGEIEGIKARALLTNKIRVRRLVRFEARNISGFYLVRKAKLVGTNFDNTFFVEFEATQVQ